LRTRLKPSTQLLIPVKHNYSVLFRLDMLSHLQAVYTDCMKNYTELYVLYVGGPKNNRNLNVARELVVARCAAMCLESTQYSSSLPRGVNLG